MSGHSRWANIKRTKGAADAKRGVTFTKLVKEITVAARIGGGKIDGNPRLRLAVEKAKAATMPKDNIDRAIKKGTGELEGEQIVEVLYEGYGSNGVALMLETTTDNKNRTVADLRNILEKAGGSLGTSGAVGWKFTRKGRIAVPVKSITEDKLTEVVIEAGGEDVQNAGDVFYVLSTMEDFNTVRENLEKAKIQVTEAELAYVPNQPVKLTGHDAEKFLRLMDQLEENEDIQKVHADAEIPDEELARIAAL